MSRTNALRTHLGRVAIAIFFALESACSGLPGASSPGRVPQQLRIANGSNEDIAGLTVLFPAASLDPPVIRVEFGDVLAGATTDYREVPSGVYRYAAYEYKLGGRVLTQRVEDWFGETPIEGHRFTYRIEFRRQGETGGQIQLLELLVDDP
ncbi:MAG: hypothetical protein MUO23_08870 [Anaerolineales bacterium]|nr:hypothetical protein [Anaerolineales bacterium]